MDLSREQYFDPVGIAGHVRPLVSEGPPVPERQLDPGLLTLLLEQPLRFAHIWPSRTYACGRRVGQVLQTASYGHHLTPHHHNGHRPLSGMIEFDEKDALPSAKL